MHVWMLILGGVLLIAVGYDAISTTLSIGSAAGPITSRIGGGWWKLARRLAAGPTSALVTTTGPIVILLTVTVWLALLWAGWTLIFSADPEAVISSQARQPAGGWSRVYFAGFTTFTLGVGDYVPNGAPWEVLTSIAVISGLGLTTMAITYLVPVVSAVTERRVQASTIAGLGSTPQQIVIAAFGSDQFSYLDHRLPVLAGELLKTAERHLSYPVLHFFHSAERHVDLRVQLFALDEAVTILQHGLDAPGPHPAALTSARHAVQQVIHRTVTEPLAATAPTPPDLTPLRHAGIPTVDDATFQRRLTTLADHRRRLATFADESLWPTVVTDTS